jgi:hypothetical protein
MSDQTPEITVTLDELARIVRSGEVGPTAQLRDKVMTKNAWWTLDNLQIFHRNAPAPVPPGPHLEALMARQAEAQARWAERDRAEERAFFEASGTSFAAFAEKILGDGPLAPRAFGLPTLEELASAPGVSWASRLWILPAVGRESAITLVRHRDAVEVAHDVACMRVFEAIMDRPGSEPSVELKRTRARIPLEAAPRIVAAPSEFVELSQRPFVRSTRYEVSDGVGYRHRLVSDGRSVESVWGHLFEEDHPDQIALRDAYDQCADLAA